MQNFKKTVPATAAIAAVALAAAAILSGQVSLNAPAATAVRAVTGTVQPVAAAVAGANAVTPVVVAVMKSGATRSSFSNAVTESVRAQIKFETVRWAGKPVQTLDEASRILLVRAAADKAGLKDVGLGFEEVYGLIEAETSWIQRTGASKNGTPNLGLAQFEPKTAQALGLDNPEDPVQAVFAAAFHMKHAAKWSASRISGLKLSPQEYSVKLREGVSIYYNLSVKGRNKWDGTNADVLPIETQRHIRNVSNGVLEAALLVKQLNAA